MAKKALITGITGQDGSYLAELLLDHDYEVHGTVRRTSTLERSRLSHLFNNPAIYNRRLFLHYAELSDPPSLRRILVKTQPDEIYHLAGQSHVGLSFEMVESTCEMTALGTLRLLEMVRDMERPPRLFHAGSSEMFGHPETSPQDEHTPFRPVTPYGCAKAFATHMVSIYRQVFNLFACNGILFNHESPRRGENFVTRKICLTAAAIKQGQQQELVLGNLSSERDWGDARDYVRGMWLALQHPTPEDFVFATGELHTVQEVVEIAFAAVGLDWQPYVKQDPRFLRLDEPTRVRGNPAKAARLLGWQRTTTFEQLITEMTRASLHASS
jgi:GDPmannose 4,6-dehydratase